MPFGLSFDFWNTLYTPGSEKRRHGLRVERFRTEAKKYRSVEAEEIEHVFSASTEYFFHEWQVKFRTPTSAERIARMAKMLEIDFTQEQISDLAAYFGQLIFKIPPDDIPGINELITGLAKHYPLAIISDTGYISGKHIRAFLSDQNLLSCFKSLIFSDEEQNSKPHVSLFYKTAENLGVSPEQMLHTGDLENTDIRGAISAGYKTIKFIGVNASGEEYSDADRIIETYDNFERIVQDILGNNPA